MLYLHIETSQERSGHTITITNKKHIEDENPKCKQKKPHMQQK